MQSYTTSFPRATIGVMSIAMTAATFTVFVAVPATIEAPHDEASVVTLATVTPLPVAAASTSLRIPAANDESEPNVCKGPAARAGRDLPED